MTELRGRHIALGAVAALALHAGALWLAFSATPSSGAIAPGVGGIEVSLGAVGGAPGVAAPVAGEDAATTDPQSAAHVEPAPMEASEPPTSALTATPETAAPVAPPPTAQTPSSEAAEPVATARAGPSAPRDASAEPVAEAPPVAAEPPPTAPVEAVRADEPVSAEAPPTEQLLADEPPPSTEAVALAAPVDATRPLLRVEAAPPEAADQPPPELTAATAIEAPVETPDAEPAETVSSLSPLASAAPTARPRDLDARRPSPPREAQSRAAAAPAPSGSTGRIAASRSAAPTAGQTAAAAPTGAEGAAGSADVARDGDGRAAARASGGDPGAQADYAARIAELLAREKRYPRQARARQQEGSGAVVFTVAADGRVLTAALQESTGHSLLDDEILALLRRVDPLPPIPEEAGREAMRFVVPIGFTLR